MTTGSPTEGKLGLREVPAPEGISCPSESLCLYPRAGVCGIRPQALFGLGVRGLITFVEKEAREGVGILGP